MLKQLSFVGAVIVAAAPGAAWSIDHGPFDRLLKSHVKRGKVDYATIKRDAKGELDGYVAAVGKARPGKMKRQDQLAFYLNAYNALVLKAVVDRYPIKSVMKVPGFFKRQRHTVAGKAVTLDQLEKRIILPTFKDPRVHFALVCAAKSCPPLRSGAFFGGSVDKVLDRLARNFVNSWSGVRVQGDKIRVSQIFNWYAKDFADSAGTVGKFLARYSRKHAARLTGAAGLGYLGYDWSLNDAR